MSEEICTQTSAADNDLPSGDKLHMPHKKKEKSKVTWVLKDLDSLQIDVDCEILFSDPPNEMSPMQFFKLFFSNQMFENIARETNIYSFLKTTNSVNTNSCEIEQFFGIHTVINYLLLAGLISPTLRRQM